MMAKIPPLDAPLHAMGFRFDVVAGDGVAGRLTVSDICCQVLTNRVSVVSVLVAERIFR